MFRRNIFIMLLLFPMICFSQSEKGIRDVFAFGAKGDGKTLDTKSIQAAIDHCYQSGGGKVILHSGCFLSGTIYLKSHVRLHIESGATLMGSDLLDDFPVTTSKYPSVTGNYTSGKALIYAEDMENIAITGNGTIDGRGDDLCQQKGERPHIIHFRACRNIKIRDIRLYNSATWVQKYQLCNDLLIEGITVDSRENKDIEKERYADVPGRNTDGCNIVDCSNVRIANCNIISGDDGIVFKSFSRSGGCYNVTVSNCIISTNASGIKIGTESAGIFKDFTINNCVIYDSRVEAIGIESVDGATIDQIIVSNITLRNIKGTAIFMRLGNRGRVYQKNEEVTIGNMKNILIQNIYGTEIERYGCSITGIPEASIENVTLKNIRLTFKGGNTPFNMEGRDNRPVKERTVDDVPEMGKDYPRCEMFGKLPAYGFYIRHVNHITLDNMDLDFAEDDHRPALVADDVQELFIHHLWAEGTPQAPSLIHLKNVREAFVTNSGSSSEIAAFIQLSGSLTKNIKLRSNQLKATTKKAIAEENLLRQVDMNNN